MDAGLGRPVCDLAVVKHGNQKDRRLPIIIVHSRINGNLVSSLFSLFIYARYNIDDRKKWTCFASHFDGHADQVVWDQAVQC